MTRPSRTGGKTSEAKARNASPAKGRKTTKTKPRIAPAATRVKRRPVSDPSEDLKEAREQQAATAEILKVIASSPNDVQPVFSAIATSANRLIGGFSTAVTRYVGGVVHLAAFTPTDKAGDEALKASFPRPLDDSLRSQALRNGGVMQIPDTEIDPQSWRREMARKRGFRSQLLVPLMSNGSAIGMISVTRVKPGAFAPHHVQLLLTFADQAVIAVENVRLFDEVKAKTEDLTESLQQQTATADVLKVISRSAFDLQKVLDTLADSAARLCEADTAIIHRRFGDDFAGVASFGLPEAERRAVLNIRHKPGRGSTGARVLQANAPVVIDDAENDPEYTFRSRAGLRSMLGVPMIRDGAVTGMILLARKRVQPFSQRHVDLATTFADQAVIAIENVRLFDETQEALERQTATADILKVIASSPSDVQPVFEAIATSANRLIGGFSTAVYRVIDDIVHLMAFTPTSPKADEALKAGFPLHRKEVPPLALVQSGETAQIADAETADPQTQRLGRTRGWRSVTFTPLMSQGTFIGFIVCTRRETGVLADHHVQLLRTFADQAVIAIENVRLFHETQEALERQTATADILKVIASSPTDVQPVFEAIVANAARLIGGFSAGVFRFVGGAVHLAAITSINHAGDDAVRASFPRPIGDVFAVPQAGGVLAIADTEDYPDALLRRVARAHGGRSVLYVPLKSSGTSIGAIAVGRKAPGAFAPHHIELLQTFADQAVIAIENVRLFIETQEALERQTATADILKVIASSPSEVQPVFEAIAERSNRLVQGLSTTVQSLDDDTLHIKAFTRTSPEADAALQASFPRPLSGFPWGERIRGGEIVHMPDVEVELAEFPVLLEVARLRGFRSMLFVPLLREGTVIGIISVTHATPGRFADHHVQLLQTFADQAVIAIGNVRLFDEVQAKTRDLSEALTYQTGSANILNVIASSPTDIEPVLNAIVEGACELCEANDAAVLLKDGEHLRFRAHHGPIDINLEKWPITRGLTAGRAFLDGKPVHLRDTQSEEANEFPDSRALSVPPYTNFSVRTVLSVPLLRESERVGAILLRRIEMRPFSDKQIALLQTFADQAVIAINNARLFDEVQAKTRDLTESLQQQTATSEVLQVISSSPGDLAPVFDKMLENATRICGAEFGSMVLVESDTVRRAALYNVPPAFAAMRTNEVWQVHPRSSMATVIRSKQVVQVEDMRSSPAYLERSPMSVQLVELGGARTIVVVPMLREDEVIGLITVYRQEVRPFSDKQIELLTNFARQAVIAIENARLLRELQQRTDDLSEALVYQTGSGNILKVIASSPTDVAPTLKAIVESACEICDANDAVVFLKDGGDLVFAAHHGPIPINLEQWPINRKWITGRAVVDKAPQHIHDLLGPEGDDFAEGRELQRNQGQRTVLSVPLLREGEAIGAISLRRIEVQPFNDKQIELLKSFADQAVIAISNVRLFEQVQERTRELSRLLNDLRTAQDRLIQTEKLASLGQLTAGIAHEIKNPLNFVNNFSALSAELTDELNDLLKPAPLDDKMRGEADELTGMIKDNLRKVVQHGKRADSIVKNMLMHSREGSREHRPADINSLLDESLNLAYHGARAEKGEFNITLQRDFDADAGTAELFPQEITRAFLNLIANGVYAATKRKTEENEPGFEPTLRATTKNLGTTVEIRIRDNGTGIPPEVQEKMFNPFFTTKPAGEGTGLGLSMTHDIIVKQHGGRIDVATEPGQFTEFIIVLPRMAATGKAGADK